MKGQIDKNRVESIAQELFKEIKLKHANIYMDIFEVCAVLNEHEAITMNAKYLTWAKEEADRVKRIQRKHE